MIVILGSPFVRSLVSSPLEVTQCEDVNLLFQVVQSSDGTPGSNVIEFIQLEQFRNGLSTANSTSSGSQQIVKFTFTALSSRSGNYSVCKNICNKCDVCMLCILTCMYYIITMYVFV